ncbi:MAG: nuclear transport factor 2 family protein [Terriglobales bacterium]
MKRMVCAVSLILVLMVGIATAAWDKDSSHPAVSTVQEFTNAYNNKNIDKLVSLYAVDAVMVSEAGVAEGRDAIRARLDGGIQRGNTIASLSPERNDSSGALSYTEGVAKVINNGQELQRHYLVIVKKVGASNEIVIHYSLPSPAKTP